MSVPLRSTLAVAVAAAALAGALQTLLAARSGAAAILLPALVLAAVLIYRRPILGAQLALLATPLELLSLRLGGGAGLTPTEGLLLLTAAASVTRWALAWRRPPVPAAILAVGGLCLAVAFSALAAEDRAAAAKVLVMWSAFAVVGVTVAQASARDLRRLLACLAIAGGIAGAIAISGGTAQTLSAGGNLASGRAQGGFSQPNVLGFFLVLAIPPCVVLAARGRPAQRMLMGLLGALAVWGLVLTLSRTSIVGAALGLTVLLAWPGFRRVAAVGLALLIVVSIFNVHAIEQSHQLTVVSQRLATLARSGTAASDPRMRIWSTGIDIFAAHPVAGVGADNFRVATIGTGLRDELGNTFEHAHDVPITVAAELGVPGLAALAWLAAALGALALRALRRSGDPRLDLLGLGVLASLVGIVVPSLGDYPARTNAIAGTFVVLVGALVAADRLRRSVGETPAAA